MQCYHMHMDNLWESVFSCQHMSSGTVIEHGGQMPLPYRPSRQSRNFFTETPRDTAHKDQPFQPHVRSHFLREVHSIAGSPHSAAAFAACEFEEVLLKPLKESKFRFKTCTTLGSHAAQSPQAQQCDTEGHATFKNKSAH